MTQTRGACSACHKNKRKCNRQLPKCGQCERNQVSCEPRIFKYWKTPRRDSAILKPPKRPRRKHNHPARESGAAEVEAVARRDEGEVISTAAPQPQLPSGANAWNPPDESVHAATLAPTTPVARGEDCSAYQAWEGRQDVAPSAPGFLPPSPASRDTTSPETILDDDFLMNVFNDLPALLVTEIPREVAQAANSTDADTTLQQPSPTLILDAWTRPASSPNLLILPGSSLPPVSVPQSLPTMPAELLDSTERGFLWHHYINRTAFDLFCYDYDNPNNPPLDKNLYLSKVPALAFSNRAVMGACLALSGAHYNQRLSTSAFGQLLMQLRSEAKAEIREVLEKGEDNSSERLLAASLIMQMICTSQVPYATKSQWCGWLGSMRLLIALLLSRKWPGRQGDQELVVLAFKAFNYLNVMSGLSIGPSHRRIPKVCRTSTSQGHSQDLLLQWEDVVGIGSSDLVVDPILAFSPRLVTPLRKLGALLDEVRDEAGQQASEGVDEGSDLQSRIDGLEVELLMAYDLDMTRQGSKDAPELLQCNVAFHAASHILFYARLRQMPATAPIVRMKVRDVRQATEQIPVKSRTSAALAFPLFTAGCEAVDSADRQAISARLLALAGSCFVDVLRLMEMLHCVWETRDMAPGAPWMTWISQVESAFGEFVLY
ncbi:hypothetical protein AFGD_011566 [Aspergillus flavus]|nr:hypothetical protein AFGD_011566 [Aspergillus flavus]